MRNVPLYSHLQNALARGMLHLLICPFLMLLDLVPISKRLFRFSRTPVRNLGVFDEVLYEACLHMPHTCLALQVQYMSLDSTSTFHHFCAVAVIYTALLRIYYHQADLPISQMGSLTLQWTS